MKKTAVIIGGGLGGLFTGAILAREGLEVTVIEKNATVGGGLQSFTRFGQMFDTGMHVIGGMREGGNIYRICKYLGILDKVRLQHIGPLTDTLYFAQDHEVYDICMGREGYVDALAKKFPDQRDNLVRYVDALYRLADEMDIYYLRPAKDYFTVHSEDFLMPADQFIAKYLTDERLRSVVAYMSPLYSGRKDTTPAYIHALISVLYIEGPSRFIGGSQLFADTLRDLIISLGGKVITSDGVAKIYTRDRTITRVETRKGLSFSADWYISAIHPCTLIKLLDDPSALPKAYRTRLDSIPNSYSTFALNIKLKPGTFRYIDHSCYYMNRYDKIWDFGEADAEWPMGFLYMTPPEENQGEYTDKILVTAPMAWYHVKQWEDTYVGHRGQDYLDWKESCKEKLLDMMEEVHPGFRECVEACNTASPLTVRDYYGVKEGAMCGYSKDCHNMALSQVPVVTKISNLLLTGQNCNLHGFCGVPLTAINTSEVILGLNYVINRINNV